MSYTVLARKYRPSKFEDVIGQEPICNALRNSLNNNKLHHAYLFSGTRGVGKTTIARLFAKALNCEKGVTGEPCNECGACQGIANGNFIDLIEVDGASRTKVDETRELLDNVQYAPTVGRYKVYLIDEVHMLSTHSFNALLKTLEEPPSHVKFLLATTDPAKLPVTVLSRCLQFNLKHIDQVSISNNINKICDLEKITIDEPALNVLSIHAYGSMRDALSLLDQANALGNGCITEELATSMIGVTQKDVLINLIQSIFDKDLQGAIELATEIVDSGKDLRSLLQDFSAAMQEMALMQHLPKASFTDTHDQKLFELSKKISGQEIQMIYQMALMGIRDIPLSRLPDTAFKMTLIRMIAFQLDALPVKPLRQGPEVKEIKKKPLTKDPSIKDPKNEARSKAKMQSVPIAKTYKFDDWEDLINKLSLTGALLEFAQNIELKSYDSNSFKFVISDKHQHLHTENLEGALSLALKDFFGSNIRVHIKSDQEDLKNTVSTKIAKEKYQNLKKAKEDLKSDELFNLLEAEFDAKIESIELHTEKE